MGKLITILLLLACGHSARAQFLGAAPTNSYVWVYVHGSNGLQRIHKTMLNSNATFYGFIAATNLQIGAGAWALRPKAGVDDLEFVDPDGGVALSLTDSELAIFGVTVNLSTLTASRALVLDGSKNVTTPTGTPDGTKFLRDDNTYAVPSGGSGLTAFKSNNVNVALAPTTIEVTNGPGNVNFTSISNQSGVVKISAAVDPAVTNGMNTRIGTLESGGSTPGGNSGAVQFKEGSGFGGTNELNWDRTNRIFAVNGNSLSVSNGGSDAAIYLESDGDADIRSLLFRKGGVAQGSITYLNNELVLWGASGSANISLFDGRSFFSSPTNGFPNIPNSSSGGGAFLQRVPGTSNIKFGPMVPSSATTKLLAQMGSGLNDHTTNVNLGNNFFLQDQLLGFGPIPTWTRLVLDGNSRVAGVVSGIMDSPQPWLTNLFLTNYIAMNTNVATSGHTVISQFADYTNTVQIYKPSGGTNAWLILGDAVVDVSNGSNALNTINSLSNYYWNAKNDGFKLCILGTADGSGFTAAHRSVLKSVNAYERTNTFKDAYVDIPRLIQSAAGGYADTLHFGTNQARIIAAEIVRVMLDPRDSGHSAGNQPQFGPLEVVQDGAESHRGLPSGIHIGGQYPGITYDDGVDGSGYWLGEFVGSMYLFGKTSSGAVNSFPIYNMNSSRASFDVPVRLINNTIAPTAAAVGANNGWLQVSNNVLYYFSTTDGSSLTTTKLAP